MSPMIVDSFTHVWESPEQLGRRAAGGQSAERRDPLAERLLHADPLEHFESLGPVAVSLVYGFASQLTEAKIPAKLVAHYVRSHPDRLIGVAGIDPTQESAGEQLADAIDEQGFRAVAVSPSAQGFHPMDSRAMSFYRQVARRGLPLVVHWGPAPSPAARLEFADPILLDEVLRELPDLRLVIGGLSQPWADRTLALMTKHSGVLASLGGLLGTPWQAYNTLVRVEELGLMDRVLFASNFPFNTPSACIEALYSINRVAQGSNLPTVPREMLRGIVERDALKLLGLESARPAETPAAEPSQAAPAADDTGN
jgi:predicted TIM-barrel fold metal-dependent hydrolase